MGRRKASEGCFYGHAGLFRAYASGAGGCGLRGGRRLYPAGPAQGARRQGADEPRQGAGPAPGHPRVSAAENPRGRAGAFARPRAGRVRDRCLRADSLPGGAGRAAAGHGERARFPPAPAPGRGPRSVGPFERRRRGRRDHHVHRPGHRHGRYAVACRNAHFA